MEVIGCSIVAERVEAHGFVVEPQEEIAELATSLGAEVYGVDPSVGLRAVERELDSPQACEAVPEARPPERKA